MTKKFWDAGSFELADLREEVDEFRQADEPDWVKPTEDLEYIVAVGEQGTAIFLDTPLIHESFFENAKDHLEDNGFAIPEELCAGVYKLRFKFWTSQDWESGITDDWGFDSIGEPELLFEYERVEENEDNL